MVGVVSLPAGAFHATERPDLVVDKQEVLHLLGNRDVCLINSLGHREHRSEFNAYGRRGHIPGQALP